jgi:hypothetical protein
MRRAGSGSDIELIRKRDGTVAVRDAVVRDIVEE